MISGVLLLSLLKSIWDKFAQWIMLAGAVLVAVFYIFFKGKAAGKKVYKEQAIKINKRAAEKTAKIKKQVGKASDDDIQKQLEKYYRD